MCAPRQLASKLRGDDCDEPKEAAAEQKKFLERSGTLENAHADDPRGLAGCKVFRLTRHSETGEAPAGEGSAGARGTPGQGEGPASSPPPHASP